MVALLRLFGIFRCRYSSILEVRGQEGKAAATAVGAAVHMCTTEKAGSYCIARILCKTKVGMLEFYVSNKSSALVS